MTVRLIGVDSPLLYNLKYPRWQNDSVCFLFSFFCFFKHTGLASCYKACTIILCA